MHATHYTHKSCSQLDPSKSPGGAPPAPAAERFRRGRRQNIAMHARPHAQLTPLPQPSKHCNPGVSSGDAPPTSAATGTGRGRRPHSPRPTSATWDRWAALLGQHQHFQRLAALHRNAREGCSAWIDLLLPRHPRHPHGGQWGMLAERGPLHGHLSLGDAFIPETTFAPTFSVCRTLRECSGGC